MALNETDNDTNSHIKIEFETSDDDFFISKIESLNEKFCVKEEFDTVKELIKEEPVDYELEIDQPSEYNPVTEGPLSESIETNYEDNRADSCNTLNEINMESHTNKFPCNQSDKQLTKAKKINKHTFECNSCNKKFSTKGHLTSHVNHYCHPQERPYICDVCHKSYRKKSVLIMHLRTHTGERPFPCNLCEKSFSRRSNLTMHKKVHTEFRPFPCNMCDRIFRIKMDLKVHMLVHTEKQHACSMCDKKYCRKYALIVHIRTHTGEKPYGCNLCQKKFTSKSNLDQHKNSHMDKKYKKVKTKRKKTRIKERHINMEAHTTSGTALHENIPMRSKETENEIENNTNCYVKQEFIPFDKGCIFIKTEPVTNEEAYVINKNECLRCDEDLVKKELVKEESAVTTVESGWPVQKPMEYISASDSLLSENLCCTEITDTFTCDVCSRQFTSKRNLRRHIIIHSEHRSSFICKVCKRRFLERPSLTRHMRIHTGEKPFACSMCSKKFRQKGDLTKHIRTHTGQKPFSCQMCDKKFSHKYNLQMHARTHTGERPNACDQCEKTFLTKSGMNRHKKTHTKEKSLT